MLPSYSSPVFTITGVKDDLKNAFVQVVSPSQRDQVRETLEKGKYLDSNSSDTVYVWEPKSISFSEDASLAMNFGPPAVLGPEPAETDTASEDLVHAEPPPPAAEARETQVAVSGGEQSAVAIVEVTPQKLPVLTERPSPPDLSATPPAVSLPSLEVPPPVAELAPAVQEVVIAIPPREAVVEPSPEKTIESALEEVETKEALTTEASVESQETEVEKEKYLLVSKSWYIEGGNKNIGEAVRISKILRPFRWTVEPAYTIGVMLDDILSVETANGEIGGDMTRQVEGAGYRLSRVSVVKGKPVAWFKREAPSRSDQS
jgi:hypothetical protein